MKRKGASREAIRKAAEKGVVPVKGEEEGNRPKRFVCNVPGGVISVQATAGLTLGELLNLLFGLVKVGRKAESEGISIESFIKILADKAKNSDRPQSEVA